MNAMTLPQAECRVEDEPGQGQIKGRILLVDDILDNRVVLGRRLQRRGYAVVEADSGEAALAALTKQAFDLVLLDVMMPGMSGLEVLAELRKTFSSQQLPVIMVTAKSFSHDVVEALEGGADDYVTKPVDFDIALARIVAQIERKFAADSAARTTRETVQALDSIRGQLSEEIERRQASASAAEYLSTYDPLTGLLNRRSFTKQAEIVVAAHAAGGPSYSVLFVDLDRFKTINDTLGHSIGDRILSIIASRMTAAVQNDDLLARFGGDEFVVMHMKEVGTRTTEALAQQIIAAVSEPILLDGQELQVGASIGFATPAHVTEPLDTTLSHADVAMYRAKADGGDRSCQFEPEMAEALRLKMELERDLRTALRRNQLQLLYQPVVDLSRHRIVGFEALLRWHHPTRGTIAPDDFIPIAEETGLIVAIGEWVLRQACAAAVTWPDGIRVAVNLSPMQFERGNLCAAVSAALQASGLEPQRLELEVTETLLFARRDQTMATFAQLQAIGVRMAMDDFGTGFSSLGNLKDFEFDKVKIDKSFIQTLAKEVKNDAIVGSIIYLASRVGMTTTAEGVETELQLDQIRHTGINEVQGFFFGKPMACDAVLEAITCFND
jgi:diguanylate cyclase (GGDEF)-like protein